MLSCTSPSLNSLLFCISSVLSPKRQPTKQMCQYLNKLSIYSITVIWANITSCNIILIQIGILFMFMMPFLPNYGWQGRMFECSGIMLLCYSQKKKSPQWSELWSQRNSRKRSKFAHFAQNAQFWNIFVDFSAIIIQIFVGICLLFPIFQRASFEYHKQTIR